MNFLVELECDSKLTKFLLLVQTRKENKFFRKKDFFVLFACLELYIASTELLSNPNETFSYNALKAVFLVI